ncbi:hypothetical protein M422DRAFT_256543 [Sphaerobolus stellatus SS14]|uniref:Uncharacterized protein n=1 Tax=Sphaerobolus stellatus (strain SS14) TaxID=990650 RepID=A0A0C9VQP5_SPHS4|nr:hypothetical protein M422DRAFT_262210 [Sphaerobolus stellatus SS14]KIJ40570.1 hypothetical protein M422DRAFT_256543 [Sphaerobolus stellatus SS14]
MSLHELSPPYLISLFTLCIQPQSDPRTSLVKHQSGFTWPLPLPAILLTSAVIGSTEAHQTKTKTYTHLTTLVTSSTTIQTTHVVTFTASQTTHTIMLPTTSVTSTTVIVDLMSTTLTTTTAYSLMTLSTSASYAAVEGGLTLVLY